jgi:hypothetical protein
MKRLLSALRAGATLGALILATSAWAGRTCDDSPMPVETVERGLRLALATERQLHDSGARVVVLARAGQDLSAHGLQWSHLGLAYRDGEAADSPWRVLHKLNHCGSAEAALFRQGLGPFFMDRPWRHEAAFVPLSPAVQDRLWPLLRDNTQALRLHEARYNLVAYPWATRYQQSNQWAIETLAMAMEPAVQDRAGAQAWLRLRRYQPTVLQLGPMTRLAARMTRANVAFDDHPDSERFRDRVATVTVDSVFEWLQAAGLADPAARSPITRITL